MASVSQTLARALDFHRAGDLEHAEGLYREIVRIDPKQPDALHLLGVTSHQRRQHGAAVDFICRAIASNPAAAPYHSNLAAAQRALGRFEEAAGSLERAVALDPKFADAHYNLGTIYKDLGRYDDAIAAFRRALTLSPDHAESLNNLGIVLKERGRIGEAIQCYLRAIKVRSDLVEAHNNLGTALFAAERFEEAAASHRKAVELRPNFAEALFNLGNALAALDEQEQAIASYRRALELDPRHADACLNLGVALKETGRYDEATACYERALSLRPNFAEARINRAFVRRLTGDLKRGWDEYEWRWAVDVMPHRGPQPAWDGTPLPGKTLLIFPEQGVGDEIMFASLVQEAAAQAAHCIVECDARLVPLFARSFPSIKVIATPTEQQFSSQLPHFDVQIPAGSLAQFFRPSLDRFPRRQAYLLPEAARRRKWASRFEQLGAGLRVGISWRGGRKLETQRARSTTLEDWLPVLSRGGATFVNLQYGDCSAELARMSQKHGIRIRHWADADAVKNLDDFAAQISALDLVISVDNSTVHMAGALGCPVWTLLPFVPDWRWMLDRDDSPWYPSMRLFRQSRRSHWADVFERVAHELSRFRKQTTDQAA